MIHFGYKHEAYLKKITGDSGFCFKAAGASIHKLHMFSFLLSCQNNLNWPAIINRPIILFVRCI